jgi:two-component system phosphate regulon sensor histidine kinase PhoR
MRELVEDILVISELDESINITDEARDKTEVELVRLTRRIVERLSPYAEQSGINLKLVAREPTIFVYGSESIISEMIYNLTENAIRYNRAAGSVEITITELPDKARLVVADTGIGIPLELQDKVFERFYCVDRSRSRDTGGTGLGLAIVKHGAQYLGARLKLQSTPDVGTTITLEFPI